MCSGKVIVICRPRKRQAEFIELLEEIERRTETITDIHSAPDRFWRFGIAFHLFDSVGHPNSQISRLDRAACMLAVYASRSSLLTHTQDSLPAGGQPWSGGY